MNCTTKVFLFLSVTPTLAQARGSLNLDAFLYVGLAILGIFILLYFWMFIFSIPFLIISFFDKNIREGLVTFATGGFWWTVGIPLVFGFTRDGQYIYFKNTFFIILWLLLWYGVAKYLQYKEDRFNHS